MIMPPSVSRSSAESRSFPWYAVKVRVSGELKVKQALERKGYEIFLPTHRECRWYSDRIKKVDAALFPGYLFCRLDIDHRLPLLTTSGVESIVSVCGHPEPIEEAEIAAVQRVAGSKASAIPWPYLQTGDTVTIEFGSLAGLTGILVRSRGSEQLVLSVHLLQRSIAVEIDRTWIRPLRIPSSRPTA